jgi:acyl carrier protein
MKEEVKSLVRKVANDILFENGKIMHGDSTILYSSNGLFDSMDLVNFVSILEEQIFIQFTKTIQLSHPSVFSSNKSPFKDIESTTEFILSLL